MFGTPTGSLGCAAFECASSPNSRESASESMMKSIGRGQYPQRDRNTGSHKIAIDFFMSFLYRCSMYITNLLIAKLV